MPAASPSATSTRRGSSAWPSSSVVGTVAVAVLEVDAEVLDRLAAQLLATRA